RTVMSTATSAGAQNSAKNSSGVPPSASAANRLVRFDTGRNSEAVLANQTVARANGSGERPTCRVRTTMTGVMRTAVVSKDMNAVDTVTMAKTKSHST